MASSIAAMTKAGAGGTPKATGDQVANFDKIKALKQRAATNAQAPVSAEGGVQPHGDEAHSSGGAEAPAVVPPPAAKKKGGMWGGIGKALTGGLSGLFYKMPASEKHGNSPIDKNFGDKSARGFNDTPLEMKSFGVGSLSGGVNAKGRSKTGVGGKFNK